MNSPTKIYLLALVTFAGVIPSNTQAAQPPVTLAQPVEVKVVNPVEVHGLIETINDALKTPFHLTTPVLLSDGQPDRGAALYQVPAGKRLTIETISVFLNLGATQRAIVGFTAVGATGTTTGSYMYAALPLQLQGQFGSTVVLSGLQSVKIILDAATPDLSWRIDRSGSVGIVEGRISISGYLEDAAP